MKPNLVLLTNNYPKSNGSESIFLRDELKEAVKYFNRIYIVPADTGFDTKINVPNENITFIDLANYKLKGSGLETAAFRFKLLFKTVLYAIANKKLSFLNFRSLSYEFAYLKKTARLGSRFATFVNSLENEKVYAYSYWFDIWPLILSKASVKNRFSGVISRAHGFDIFPEQQKHKFDPYFKIKLKNVDRVSSVSLKGKVALQDKSPTSAEKITHSNLGIARNAASEKKVEDKKFLIVSCSIITELKRVFLIPEILKHLTIDYTWVHFGEGSTEDTLIVNKAIEKNKVNGSLNGYISNSELMKFYKEREVNLFINVSSSEGIPFSIMEAMSFGIPCMATNVGGNSEIVDGSNGFLIPKQFDPKKVADNINKLNVGTQSLIRAQAFKRWEEKFNAERNYKDFYSLLIAGN